MHSTKAHPFRQHFGPRHRSCDATLTFHACAGIQNHASTRRRLDDSSAEVLFTRIANGDVSDADFSDDETEEWQGPKCWQLHTFGNGSSTQHFVSCQKRSQMQDLKYQVLSKVGEGDISSSQQELRL
ncbi:uncharacterized protein [Dermacentor albipictus]|uniref:uncharacterized protein n=1 Tax=Dermacentor albipictus TaxID=60249 RepID=UPI0038FC6A71